MDELLAYCGRFMEYVSPLRPKALGKQATSLKWLAYLAGISYMILLACFPPGSGPKRVEPQCFKLGEPVYNLIFMIENAEKEQVHWA